MQAIAGIHFNVSLPESAWSLRAELLGDAREAGPADPTRGYFATMCNLVNVGWMVPWLFGASPAICRTFLAPGATTDLDTLAGSTLYAPDGTSLRMGNIGYRYREDVPIDLSVDHSGFGAVGAGRRRPRHDGAPAVRRARTARPRRGGACS